jgi:hypothetical protein
VSDDQAKVEFWAQQAMMWHEKYKSVLALEADYHRYRIALERIAEARNEATKERVRLIAKNALEDKP